MTTQPKASLSTVHVQQSFHGIRTSIPVLTNSTSEVIDFSFGISVISRVQRKWNLIYREFWTYGNYLTIMNFGSYWCSNQSSSPLHTPPVPFSGWTNFQVLLDKYKPWASSVLFVQVIILCAWIIREPTNCYASHCCSLAHIQQIWPHYH